MAFDSIEPLDAAGVILRGLSGSGSSSGPPPAPSKSWQVQKAKMIQHINLVKGK